MYNSYLTYHWQPELAAAQESEAGFAADSSLTSEMLIRHIISEVSSITLLVFVRRQVKAIFHLKYRNLSRWLQ